MNDDLKRIQELLDKEEAALLRLSDLLECYSDALTKKDTTGINQAVSTLEGILTRIENIEEERNLLLSNLKSRLGMDQDSSIYALLNSLPEEQGSEILQKVTRLLEKLHGISLQLDHLQQVTGFHLHYIDFLAKLAFEHGSSGTYDQNASLKRDSSTRIDLQS